MAHNPRGSSAKREFGQYGQPTTRRLGEVKKQKKSHQSNVAGHDKSDLDLCVNNAIGKMDACLLADYVARSAKRFATNQSLVDLEDKRIPASAFLDTSDWNRSRTLDELSSFLDHYSSKFETKSNALASTSTSLGTPHTLVVTSAGLRAADLVRVLRPFQTKDALVAKLFAKHIKLREATEMVKKTRINIGVGTPTRIIDLVDSGALSLLALNRIVIDCSYLDQKKRGIFDMRETQEPLIRLLNRPELKDRCGASEGKIQLILF